MPTSPLPLSAKLHRQGQRLWRFIKSLYYASTPSWQLLKSGALFFSAFSARRLETSSMPFYLGCIGPTC